MIKLKIVEAGNLDYQRVCSFASDNYLERLGVLCETFPPMIVYAEDQEGILASIGLTSGEKKDPLLVETYFEMDLLSHISKGQAKDRGLFFEVNTLSVSSRAPRNLSKVMCAAIGVVGHKKGYGFAIMTTIRIIQRMVESMGVKTIMIGPPDILKKDLEFQKKWERYFELKPKSYGVDLRQAFPWCLQNITLPDVDFMDLII